MSKMNTLSHGFLAIYAVTTMLAITYAAIELQQAHIMWMMFVTGLASLPYSESRLKMSRAAFVMGCTYTIIVSFCLSLAAVKLENPVLSLGFILSAAILFIFINDDK